MEVPVIFLNKILVESAKRNAYLLHLTVGSPPIMRVNGELLPMEGESMITVDIIEKIINSFITPEEREKLEKEREIVLVKSFAGNFRFRINIFYQKNLLSLSFRHISENIKTLSNLKLSSSINNLLKLKSGLFIVAGSHGSGRTTTAAAIIEEINVSAKKRIITLENPLENLFISKKSLIEQREIGKDVLSAVDGLHYCLEEDANLVYVGEIESELKEAMPYILQLASGNCVVIMEINADSSIRVIEKLLDYLKETTSMEAARYNLSDVLFGVMVQKLMPRMGGGMVLAVELLLGNPAARALIREGKIYQLESVMQTSRKEGMVSMAKSIEELIKSGEIKQEDI